MKIFELFFKWLKINIQITPKGKLDGEIRESLLPPNPRRGN